MDRLLKANLNLDKEAFEFLHFVLNQELAADYFKSIKEMVPEQRQKEINEAVISIEEAWDFGQICFDITKLLSKESRHRARIAARRSLELQLSEMSYDESTTFGGNIREFRRMFHLDDIETELCIFLFIMSNWGEFEAFFENHLQCNRYQGRRWLAVILNCRESQLVRTLSGKLYQTGILEKSDYRGDLSLKLLFKQQLQDLCPSEFRTQFMKPLKCDHVPLDSHMIEGKITRNVLTRLSYKPETSTHILLYGLPGTGKTSYALGIAKKLGLTCYQLDHGDTDRSLSRRAAITASVNIVSETDTSLLVADDCDSILNTGNAWTFLGETPDKPWIHEILEKPGVRMIWIVNSVDNIEESVARRFSFSVNFKPFNRRQRIIKRILEEKD